MYDIADIESRLFDGLPADPGGVAPAVFLVGGPRAGDAIVYRALASAFRLPFLSNFVNELTPLHPAVGLAIQQGQPVVGQIGLRQPSSVLPQPFAPSDAPAVMTGWFGDGHPSQVVASEFRPGRAMHMARTVAAAAAMSGGRPLLVKNGWNSFRVKAIAGAVPRAWFIWVRRDIARAARAELAARRRAGPSDWQPATPANLAELERLPPARKSVENQYEFNRAISLDLSLHAPGRSTAIWFEDFIADPAGAIHWLERTVGLLRGRRPLLPPDFEVRSEGRKEGAVDAEDADAIDSCLADIRFDPYRHPGQAAPWA